VVQHSSTLFACNCNQPTSTEIHKLKQQQRRITITNYKQRSKLNSN